MKSIDHAEPVVLAEPGRLPKKGRLVQGRVGAKKCPLDGEHLLMTDRNGIEVDHCPKCRGIWLDRGELDKIIAQATPAKQAAAIRPERGEAAPSEKRGRDRDRDDDDDDDKKRHRKSRSSFLGDLFDF
jgi:Zn-finger nucleic acid-binding protein